MRRSALPTIVLYFHSAHVIHAHRGSGFMEGTQSQEDESTSWISETVVLLKQTGNEIERPAHAQSNRSPACSLF
jgi:hypothetical protein